MMEPCTAIEGYVFRRRPANYSRGVQFCLPQHGTLTSERAVQGVQRQLPVALYLTGPIRGPRPIRPPLPP